MLFDRPTYVPVYMTLSVTRKSATVRVDIALIKEALSLVPFKINQSALVTELYGTIYSAGSTFFATDLLISNDNITFVASKLDNGFKDIFTVDIANITVTEIIP
jgi:hypothetical protein